MEFDIYGVFKDVLDENVTSKAGPFNDIEGNGKDVESPFDYVDLFSHDAWNINSYTETCQNICNNCVKTNERFLKFTNADILACVKVEDTSQLAVTTRQNKKSRRVRFSTGVSISVDSNFHHEALSEMEFETDLEEPIICDDDITRGVPYPHTGEGENKIESAFYEDIRTVGYGRTDKYNFLTYNNPFDPRITFQGLGPKPPQEDGAQQTHTGNAFLAVGNLDDVLDNYFNGYRNHLHNICGSPVTFTARTADDHITCHPDADVQRIDIKIDDGGSLECKKLFEKIRSGPVREIWSSSNDAAQLYETVPTAQKNNTKEKQTETKVKEDNRSVKTEVKPSASDFTESYKHTKPNLNKNTENENKTDNSYRKGEKDPTGCLEHDIRSRDKMETPSAPHGLGWSVDCWNMPKGVIKYTHDDKPLRRAASESLTETLRGEIENVKSRTSHCADDGSLQVPTRIVSESKRQPSGDKEVTGIQHGDELAKQKPGVVHNMQDLQNWAEILFKNKPSQKDQSRTTECNKEKNLDKDVTNTILNLKTPEENDNAARKAVSPTHTEPILTEANLLSSSEESNTTAKESVSTSDKIESNKVKTTTSCPPQTKSQQATPTSIRNTVAEIRTYTSFQKNQSAPYSGGVHQIPTILTSGNQRVSHYSGYQQDNSQYWASRNVLPTNFPGYHNYSGASSYPNQTVRQPPPGFTLLGANRMQQSSRPNVQVNYPTPLLATAVNKRMYTLPDASRQRYPQTQPFLGFASYPPYYPTSGHLSHNYNIRTGWTVNMNNNNSNDNNNNNNNSIDFDNFSYPDGHHQSLDYSTDPLGFDPQTCNIDYPQTCQSSMESYQDSMHIKARARPLRSNLIRIFPSNDL